MSDTFEFYDIWFVSWKIKLQRMLHITPMLRALNTVWYHLFNLPHHLILILFRRFGGG